MKSDGRLARCPLKGRIGDAIFAVLRACGHDIRAPPSTPRALFLYLITAWLRPQTPHQHQALAA
jgi:IS5 family transposase